MKGVFGASLGTGWLYELRPGTRRHHHGPGNVRGPDEPAISALHEQGRHDDVRESYSKFLLMRNLNQAIPGTDLYIMKKRGVFRGRLHAAQPRQPRPLPPS